MKKIITTLSLFAFFITFSSCERVIEIELKNTDPIISIEGSITNTAGPDTIVVSKSVSFNEQNEFPMVSGAVITLEDNHGNAELLTEVAPGKYITSNMAGHPGTMYTLTVTSEGKTYVASSTMPVTVRLDSVHVVQGMRLGGPFYYLIPQWIDPENELNYYRCLEFTNGKRVHAELFDDANTNGNVNMQPMISFETDFVPGDTVLVELQSIDASAYRYFHSLGQAANNNTSAPANPVSNFSNGALGYFSAHTVDQRMIVIY